MHDLGEHSNSHQCTTVTDGVARRKLANDPYSQVVIRVKGETHLLM